MRNNEQILEDLKSKNWVEYGHHPFVDEVLLSAINQQLNDDEHVYSKFWGIRLNEVGEFSSQYELIALTDKHLISIYSDLNNENDKVHVYSQPLNKVDKFSVNESKNHEGYDSIKIILNGVGWTLESNDLPTVDHFNQQIASILNSTPTPDEIDATLAFKDEKTATTDLKTVHVDDFLTRSKKTTKEWTEKNLTFLKKHAKTNLLWYSIIVFVGLFQLIVAASFLGVGAINHLSSKDSLITAAVFMMIFTGFGIFATIVLTMKVWDQFKFSKELYHILVILLIQVIAIIFSIIMMASLGRDAYICALYLLPMSFVLLVDAGYQVIQASFQYKHLKRDSEVEVEQAEK